MSFSKLGIRQRGVPKKYASTSDMANGNTGSTEITPTSKTFTWVNNGDTNDIIYWLGSAGKTTPFTNPNTNGIISTTSLSLFAAGYEARNIHDRVFDTNGNIFSSESGSDGQWIMDDFKSKTLKVTDYCLKARDDLQSGYANFHLPRSWKLQGSKDALTWTDLDARVNDSTLASGGSWGHFICNQVTNSADNYRYIRMLQTGLTSTGNNYLTLGELCLYGELF